jgi:hypothetical protein
VDWLVLAVYLALLPPAIFLVWRRPIFALYAFVVGLVLHNAASLLLFSLGADGWQLTVVQSWKETLLAVALARGLWEAVRRRRLPTTVGAHDMAALAFAAVVVLYALIPQDVLGGQASAKAELYGLRHYLLPVAAYLAGRLSLTQRREQRVVLVLCLAVGAATAVAGIVEEYLLSVESWRDLGAHEYFREQLGFPEHHGPGGLPENFVLNTSDGVFRRLVSFFLSPLGSAYLFVLVLCLAVATVDAAPRPTLVAATAALVFAGLLFSFTRSALAALAGALVVLGATVRRALPLATAVAVVVATVAFAAVFPTVAPETHFLAADLPYQEQRAREQGSLPSEGPLGSSVRLADPSAGSHTAELERSARNLASHPYGFGIGNAGQTAQRFGVPSQAGETFYLELGIDAGIAGLGLWLAFVALVLRALFLRTRRGVDLLERRFAAGLLAGGAALLVVAVISDVWGVPWVTYVFWWLAGSEVARA